MLARVIYLWDYAIPLAAGLGLVAAALLLFQFVVAGSRVGFLRRRGLLFLLSLVVGVGGGFWAHQRETRFADADRRRQAKAAIRGLELAAGNRFQESGERPKDGHEARDEVALDPWGIRYRVQTTDFGFVDASSAGPDRTWGTADDIR